MNQYKMCMGMWISFVSPLIHINIFPRTAKRQKNNLKPMSEKTIKTSQVWNQKPRPVKSTCCTATTSFWVHFSLISRVAICDLCWHKAILNTIYTVHKIFKKKKRITEDMYSSYAKYTTNWDFVFWWWWEGGRGARDGLCCVDADSMFLIYGWH